MEELDRKQEDIRQRAEYLMHQTRIIIRELDNWMPTEEANERMMREIMERNKSIKKGETAREAGAEADRSLSESKCGRRPAGRRSYNVVAGNGNTSGNTNGNTVKSHIRNRWKAMLRKLRAILINN